MCRRSDRRNPGNRSIRWGHGRACLAATCLLLCGGCGRPDVSDPGQVGEAAWRAIAGKDIGALQRLVVPEDRPKFTAAALRRELDSLPPLPDTIVVVVEVTGERGQALVAGWAHPHGLQMVNRAGRWWIEF